MRSHLTSPIVVVTLAIVVGIASTAQAAAPHKMRGWTYVNDEGKHVEGVSANAAANNAKGKRVRDVATLQQGQRPQPPKGPKTELKPTRLPAAVKPCGHYVNYPCNCHNGK